MKAYGTGVYEPHQFDGERDAGPEWSADGSKIVSYTTFDTTGATVIYSMNANGSGLRRVTTISTVDFERACSPEGTKIAFTDYTHATSWSTGSHTSERKRHQPADPELAPRIGSPAVGGGRCTRVCSDVGGHPVSVFPVREGSHQATVTSDAAPSPMQRHRPNLRSPPTSSSSWW